MAIVPKNRLLDMAAQLDRPFKCSWEDPHCLKRFNRKSDLARHYRIHTNERPYFCDVPACLKSFIQRSALTVHKRTHTGEKPHKCGQGGCDKKFSDSSSLARHRRIHNGTKPYTCPANCGKQFCRKTTLTRHVQKCHPEAIVDESDPRWEDEGSGSEYEVDSEEELLPEPEVEFAVPYPGIQLNTRPNGYFPNYWPLPCETAQETHHMSFRSSPVEEAMQAQIEQQALVAEQARIDQQVRMEEQARVDQQARIDEQARVHQQAQIDQQDQLQQAVQMNQQMQMDQHYNSVPMQSAHYDPYYLPVQQQQQEMPQAIFSILGQMSLNGQQQNFYQRPLQCDEDKPPSGFDLPSVRMYDHQWQ